MGKAAVYILLILIFLGVSRSFSPYEEGVVYIQNETVFSNYFQETPVSVILIDYFSTGFFIKTHYQRYKVIYGFSPPTILTVRTNVDFVNKNKNNLGMSIYRRKEREHAGLTTPMPPGMIYVGDPAYGNWVFRKSGHREWKFYRLYRRLPEIFGWGDFIPTYEFYQLAKVYDDQQNPFFGPNNEFGTNGTITQKYLKPFFNSKNSSNTNIKDVLRKFYKRHILWEEDDRNF